MAVTEVPSAGSVADQPLKTAPAGGGFRSRSRLVSVLLAA
jgi:hypothetical protein